MSATHTAAVWTLAGDIGATARLVLLCLADHAAYNGRVSMSLPQIGDCCGLSVRSVQRVIVALAQAQLIDVLDPGMGNGKTPAYQVMVSTRQVAVPDNRGTTSRIEDPRPNFDGTLSHETCQKLQSLGDGNECDDDENTTDQVVEPETRHKLTKEIPADPQVYPEHQAFRDLNTTKAASVDNQGSEGADGFLLGPDDAPVPPVAGGGTPFQDAPPAIYSLQDAPPAPQAGRMIPSFLPPTDVGRVLAAVGVELGDRPLLFWWQQEHKAELLTMLSRLGLTVDALVDAISAKGRKMPDIRHIADIEALVGVRRG